MNIVITVFLILTNILIPAPLFRTKDWRGLKPLHSNRADVARLLGPGANSCNCAYYLDQLNVFFDYSTGDCQTGGSGGWNVPPDTLLRIVVYPKPNPRLSELQLDLREFEKRVVGHLQTVSYVNTKLGLIIDVDDATGTVMGFYYVPSDNDKRLRCSNK